MSIALGQISPILENEELAHQSWPEGTLYVVATPIGNLGDISLRALYALQKVDVIACEDTRSSKALLNSYGISTPLMAAHKHNEVEAAHQIIQKLQQGKRVALISDAGAPAVSDPGGKLVRLVKEAGFDVRPIPGASAVITALMGSGVTHDENPGFIFAGFVPHKANARKQWLAQWQKSGLPVIMFESPHRIVACIQDVEEIFATQRRLTVARELTKRFEQIVSLPVGEALAWFQQDNNRQKGEFVLILSPEEKVSDDSTEYAEIDRLLTVMLAYTSLKDAVKMTCQLTQHPKTIVYNRALVLKENLSSE